MNNPTYTGQCQVDSHMDNTFTMGKVHGIGQTFIGTLFT